MKKDIILKKKTTVVFILSEIGKKSFDQNNMLWSKMKG